MKSVFGLFLIGVTIITDALLLWIMFRTREVFHTIKTRFARLQMSIVLLLCVGGLLSSIQDIGFHGFRMGWLNTKSGGLFLSTVQAVLVLGGLVILVPILMTLRRLTEEFARSEAISQALVGRLPDGVTIETAGLTKRETEVVHAIAAGFVSDRELADELIISTATAATHIRNIMKKTGVKKRGDLILLVVDG